MPPSHLGLSESVDKAVSPTQTMTYLGIEFDSVKMELRVSADKCAELKLDLSSWLRKTVATKSDLQSILGKLIWVSKAIKYSRVFAQRIINEIKTLKAQKQKVALSYDIRKDFLWWQSYLSVFNGVYFIVPEIVTIQISSDACPSGMGSYNPQLNSYFSAEFPRYLKDLSIPIHLKEFVGIIIASKIWGESWTGKRVQIFVTMTVSVML